MKTISCSENRRSFDLKIPKEWCAEKIRIDANIIEGNKTEKCDFAITVKSGSSEKIALFYIELKGKDLMKAISQLESTINQLSNTYNGFPEQQAHAVCSRIIPHMTSSAQIAVSRFRRQYRFLLKWHSQKAILTLK